MLTDRVVSAISAERFSTYMIAAGHDADRALALYLWNLRLSSAFHPLLACVEVCLRNRVERTMVRCFGPEWWKAQLLANLMGRKGTGLLTKAVGTLRDRDRIPDSGRVTAELSFGFWCGMLLPKYEQALWTPV